MSVELFPYQTRAVVTLMDLITRNGAALDLDDLGVGKSFVGAAVARAWGGPLVLVCPASLIGMWVEILATCAPGRWETRVVETPSAFRWPKGGEAVIVNAERLPTMAAEIRRIERQIARDSEAAADAGLLDFNAAEREAAGRKKLARVSKRRAEASDAQPTDGTMFLVDEGKVFSKGKSDATKRLRAMIAAGRKRHGVVLALEATPLLNEPLELWNFLTTFGTHRASFGDWHGFLRAWAGAQGRFGLVWGDEPDDDKVRDALRRVSIRRMLRTVHPHLRVRVNPATLVDPDEAVAAMESDAAHDPRLAALRARGLDVYAYMDGASAKARKGLGREVSKVGFEWISRIGAAVGAAKLPAAVAWAERCERDGEPALIGGMYLEAIRVLGSRPGWGCITGAETSEQRHQAVQAFQRGDLRGLAMTIRAGGVGLNCQRAARVLVTDPDWVPAWTRQFVGRADRFGQTREVVVDHLRVADHPIETRKIELVRIKRRLGQAVDASAVGVEVAA